MVIVGVSYEGNGVVPGKADAVVDKIAVGIPGGQ
jgi:hypothetical protein